MTNGNSKQKHPTTVVLALGKHDHPVATRALVDQCCTGDGLISSEVATALGLPMKSTGNKHKKFTSVGGKFKVNQQVKLTNILLPLLSKNKTFNATLWVVPKECEMDYGVVLGQDTMISIDLDTSMTKQEFRWGEITREMPPYKYFTEQRMKSMMPTWQQAGQYLEHNVSGDMLNTDSESITVNEDSEITDATSATSDVSLQDKNSIIGTSLSFTSPSAEATGESIATNKPSNDPNGEPVAAPAQAPANSPTKTPSSVPAGNTTIIPTGEPSNVPTKSPSNVPTKNPTNNPVESTGVDDKNATEAAAKRASVTSAQRAMDRNKEAKIQYTSQWKSVKPKGKVKSKAKSTAITQSDKASANIKLGKKNQNKHFCKTTANYYGCLDEQDTYGKIPMDAYDE